jgi:hypothetical protein
LAAARRPAPPPCSFRIILPVFLLLFATIFARLWPLRIAAHLAASRGFDGTPKKVRRPAGWPTGCPAGCPAG